MTTQAEVTAMNQALGTAEAAAPGSWTAWDAVTQDIIDAAVSESSPFVAALTNARTERAVNTFHAIAEMAANSAGFTTESVGPGKDDN